MKNTISSGRITLDKEAVESLGKMVMSLEGLGNHFKGSPSRLVSWITVAFEERYFEKEKQRMCDAHEDKRAVLIDMVRQLEGDKNQREITTMLKLLRQKAGRDDFAPLLNADPPKVDEMP